jgi:sialate O-acetylesterase
LHGQYSKTISDTGPTFASIEHLPGALRLYFNHTEGGLVVKGDKPAEFAVAGKDHHWHWADAKVEGDSIIVSSPSVPLLVKVPL